jgi:hypothetical protein
VAIQDRGVAIGNLTRVVQNDDLSSEVRDSRSRLVLAVRGDVSSLDILDRDVLDVEANVVSRSGLRERLVVHLHRLNLSGQVVNDTACILKIEYLRKFEFIFEKARGTVPLTLQASFSTNEEATDFILKSVS